MKHLELSLKIDAEGLAALRVKFDGQQWNAGLQAPTVADVLEIVGAALREAGFDKWKKVGVAD